MLVRVRLGTPRARAGVTEVGSLLDVRQIRKLKTPGHTENHQVLNFASEGIWVSGCLPFFWRVALSCWTVLVTISYQCVSESNSIHDLCLKLDI